MHAPREAGSKLSPQESVPGVRNVSAGDTISIILKLVGEVCNLDCVYCYERRKPYDGNRILTPELVRRVLDQFVGRPLHVELHGGEPLLYPKSTMKELLALLVSRPKTSISIQTNGTLLDRDWLAIFGAVGSRVEFGISMDGPANFNAWRSTHSGSSSSHKTARALDLLNEHNIPTGIISVVTSSCAKNAKEIVSYFASYKNVRVLKFVPCFDFNVRQASGPTRSKRSRLMYQSGTLAAPAWAISPATYAQFLRAVFEYWMSAGLSRQIVIEPILALTQSLLGLTTSSCMFSDQKCGHVLTVYPDGSFGSCDELHRGDAFYGHLSEITRPIEPSSSFAGTSAARSARALQEKCDECSYYRVCKGGCIASRMRLGSLGRDDEYCSYRKSIIDFISAQYAQA